MAGTATKPIKTAVAATAKYGTNGGSATAAADWAAGWSVDPAAIFAAAAAAVDTWQANVSTPLAAANFKAGLAKADPQAAINKVNGPSKATFSAGVKAAAAPGGNYSTFSTAWQGALSTELATLNRTNPRGDRTTNRARQAAYDAWVDQQAGKFRVK